MGSDLNELYSAVIARNNRLKSMPERIGAGNRFRADAVRMLRTAVETLLYRSEAGLTSLTDLLTSRNGLLKRNLEAKRQDYSGRTVLVPGPELKLDECGVPVEMALDLFRPFIARQLVQQGAADSITAAMEIIDGPYDSPILRSAVEAAVADRLVLLDRSPVLHRLGVQPFRPVIVDHKSIAMHPLVTMGFNADFDGDQAALYTPLSAAALDECRRILDSGANLVSPGTGEPIASPVQDMVLGIYYLTADPHGDGPAIRYRSIDEVSEAVSDGLEIHSRIKLDIDDTPIATTAGRALFNAILPDRLRFVNEPMTRDRIWALVSRCMEEYDRPTAVGLLNELDDIGFRYATQYAATLGIGDLQPLPGSDAIIREAGLRDTEIRGKRDSGLIAEDQAWQEIWETWNQALRECIDVARDGCDLTPPYAMVASGARGGYLHLASLLGMAPPASANSGTDYASVLPIPRNRMAGLTSVEHYAVAFNGRKGMIDTHVRIEETHALTRRLMQLCRDLYITADDCGDDAGLTVEPVYRNANMVESISDRVMGRYAAEEIVIDGRTLVRKGDLIDRSSASAIGAAGITTVKIRSAVTCRQLDGVCAKCYGLDLSTGLPVAAGAAVGVLAAESFSEPATQLTLRTIHHAFIRGHIPAGIEPTTDYYGLAGLTRLLDADRVPADEAWIARSLITIFREQGVRVNDKHAEIIARLMGRFVRITSPGDTGFLPGEVVTISAFEAAKSSGRSPEGEKIILSAHEAAVLGTDGFLVKAVLNDAPYVLADAAVRGACDDLNGIRERIITGLPVVDL
jgi:DNA-directed RNA polymerase subunit beta'